MGPLLIILGFVPGDGGPSLDSLWMLGAFLFLALVLSVVLLLRRTVRRMLPNRSALLHAESSGSNPSSDNPAAFMTASMQGVIQKLREQEKELATLHQRDRERAQQTERLSEAVTRNMPAGLLLIGAPGLITSSNPAAEVALGVRALPYRRYAEVFGAHSRLADLITGCLSEGRTFRREEVDYTTPAGELRKLGVTISPIFSNPGQVTGALCLLSDLTELAALQRQVQIKENLAALGELSAGIAHEFKNALATISGYAQLILSESEGDVSENAQLILDQTRSLAHVVTEFLKFARPMELANDEVAVQPLIDRVLAEVRDAHPGVEFRVAGNFENLFGDEALLRQALLNLVRNAAEAAAAAPHGARVSLQGSIEHTAGGPAQRISISDNGPGFPKGDLSKLFVPFHTTKANGTGLGLAVVQKIVLQHGGGVEARNHPQGGAEVIIWLPLAPERRTPVDSVAAAI